MFQLTISLLVVIGCNVAVTPAETDPKTLEALQSEQSIVRSTFPSGQRGLVMAFNDLTSQVVPNADGDPRLVPGFTLMGYAFSLDDGSSWNYGGQLAVPPGLTGLRADPWLATNGDGSQVWYSFLGSTGPQSEINGDARANAIAWAVSDNGGMTFGDVQFREHAVNVDKPSIAVSPDGRDVYIAYVTRTFVDFVEIDNVEIMVSNDFGEHWDVRVLAAPSKDDRFRQNPIIRVLPTDPNTTEVVYQARPGARIEIARSINRGGDYGPPSLVVTNLLPSSQFPAALGRSLRNLVWQHFAVQPVSGRRFVAFENAGDVFVTASDDGVAWSRPVEVGAGRTGARFQPSIAASRSRVGVIMFEQPVLGSASTHVVVATSAARGTRFSAYWITSSPPEGEVPFEPCVSGPPGLTGYFGDYLGIVPLAMGDEQQPWTFYGAWADSRLGCDASEAFTAVHQHTVGALFL